MIVSLVNSTNHKEKNLYQSFSNSFKRRNTPKVALWSYHHLDAKGRQRHHIKENYMSVTLKNTEAIFSTKSFPDGLNSKESAWNDGDLCLILGWEDPLEEGIASQSSILAWRIPRTEEPGGLQSIGSQRVRHNWETKHIHSKNIP